MVKPANPFPGLRPFRPDESALFFGRDEQIGEALDRLLERRLLAVVGVSGCGKSSLVQAGMLPALEMGLAGDPAQRWRVATMRPGDGPLRELRRCLALGEGALAERSYGLLEAAKDKFLAEAEKLLLVVDQFEEIFPFRDRKLKDGAGSEADLFVSYLLRAAQDPSGRVYVLLTMRSDYLGECAKFHGLPEALNDGQYLVPRMTRQQLQEAIEGPLQAADVKMQPALLQHLLWRLFEEWPGEGPITREMAAAVGGLGGALDQEASRVLASLDAEQKRVAEVVFRRITESRRQADREEEDRPVRRPQTVADLALLAGVPDPAVLRDVVTAFEKRGLLVVRETDAGEMVDLPHECLCLRWGTLRDWIDAEARDAKSLRFLADSVGKSHLTGSALEEARAWLKAGRLNGAWCPRYLTASQTTAVADWVRQSGRIVDEAAERERVRREEELKRESEKRRIARNTAVALGLVALGFAGLGAWAWGQKSAADAQAATALARQLASRSELVFGEDSLGIERAALLATRSMRLQPTFDGDRALRRQLGLLPKTQASLAHEGLVLAVAWSPDGKSIVTGSADHTARVMEAGSGREVGRLAHQGPVLAVAWSPDGKRVATGSADKTARVMEASSGKELARLEHRHSVSSVGWSPDGKRIATGSADNTARVIQASTGEELARLAHQGYVRSVAWSPDGKLVATGSADNTARVIQASTGKELARLVHQGSVTAVAWSSDGKRVATASEDNTARVMEASTGKELARLTLQETVGSVAWSPDGSRVATASEDKTARVMEASTGKEVSRLVHQGSVTAVAWSPDGKWVATGSGDLLGAQGDARVMEASSGKEVARLAHQGSVKSVAWSPDGKWVATGSDDKVARVMEVSTGQEVSRLAHQGRVTAVMWSPNGKWVATGSYDHTTRVMEAFSGKEVARFAHQGWVKSVAWSPDGKWVATGTDKAVRVMEAFSGREVVRMVHQDMVDSVIWSPDGRWVAAASLDEAAVMEASSGKIVSRLVHEAIVNAIAWSPDGNRVATGSGFLGRSQSEARVMEAFSGKEVARLAHQGSVWSLAWSPDGKWVVTQSDDVRVMNAATGEERVRIGMLATGVRFSRDGRFLEVLAPDSTGNDLLLTRHPFAPEGLIREACGKVTRNLTLAEWRQYVGKEIPYARSCDNLPYPPDYKK